MFSHNGGIGQSQMQRYVLSSLAAGHRTGGEVGVYDCGLVVFVMVSYASKPRTFWFSELLDVVSLYMPSRRDAEIIASQKACNKLMTTKVTQVQRNCHYSVGYISLPNPISGSVVTKLTTSLPCTVCKTLSQKFLASHVHGTCHMYHVRDWLRHQEL